MTHIHVRGPFIISNLPNIDDFKENGAHGENSDRHWANMETPHINVQVDVKPSCCDYIIIHCRSHQYQITSTNGSHCTVGTGALLS